MDISKTLLVELSQLKSHADMLTLWKKAKTGYLKVSEIRASKSPTKTPEQQSASKLAPQSHTEILIRKGFRLAIDLENLNPNAVDATQLSSLKTLNARIKKALLAIEKGDSE